jgi:alginate O-acetyltransferase complex protein AlgJ
MRDLETTAIRPANAAWLTAGLLALCLAPSVIQVGRGDAWRAVPSAEGPSAWSTLRADGPLAANRVLTRRLEGLERNLEESSPVRTALLPWEQWVQTAWLATGNRKVVVGAGGWLFFRPDVESIAFPGFLEPRPPPIGGQREEDVARTSGPQALARIEHLADRLHRRGISLLVLAVPGKTAIEAAPFTRRPSPDRAPIANRSFEAFAARLRARGVDVLDATPILAAARRESGRPQYLRTDTHWTPEGMERVAAAVAERLRRVLPPAPPRPLGRRQLRANHRGDLAGALRLPAWPPLYRDETVEIAQVVDDAGEPWRPDPGAEVLLLGDSYANIYGDPTFGWGDGAGLVEQIAFHLGRPLDRLAITGGGPASPLGALSDQAAQGRDRLSGKRVVIFELVTLELLHGEW